MLAGDPLRIALVAGPFVAVPPAGYGGTERVIDTLARGLHAAGHDVTLFTTGDSTCPVPRAWLFAEAAPDLMGSELRELRHVEHAYDLLAGCDVVHDHTLLGPYLAAARGRTNVVTTNHGPFDADLADVYGRMQDRVPIIAISRHQASSAPPAVRVAAVIHHGLPLERYVVGPGSPDRLVFVGRMNPSKGVHVAARVARRAGLPLVIAAKMRENPELEYFRAAVEPLLGHGVEYVGEIDEDAKIALLGSALALLNPISWPEPFGLVMAESLACGTPVVGFANGAAPEIVDDGETGLLVNGEDALVDALGRVADLSRRRCREVAEDRFSAARMVAEHELLYRALVTGEGAGGLSPG